MNYKKISTNEYDIHIIKNKSFHTIDFRIFFAEEVSKEKITYRNFLVNMLTYATKNFDTKEKLIKKCQELYSLRPSSSIVRDGNLLVTKLGLSIIDSEYVEKNTLYDNISLLKEIILNPLVSDNKFSSKYFSTVKKELELETKTIDEEPRLYANIKLLDLINDNGRLLSSYSNLDILKEINETSLYRDYLDFIKHSKIDIFISGNIKNEKKLIEFIENNFVFHNKCPKLINGLIEYSNKKDEPIIKKETKNFQQSKLSIGFKLYNLTDYENRYVSFIFNNVFGGGANSLLMKKVREENSLCYYIGSYINRLDNVLIVNSGINKENYEQVISYIKESLKDMSLGKFKIKDIETSKMEALVELSNVLESNRHIIEYYYGRVLFSSHDLKEREKMIKKVSKEDLINFSKKINLEAIFFLEGDL